MITLDEALLELESKPEDLSLKELDDMMREFDSNPKLRQLVKNTARIQNLLVLKNGVAGARNIQIECMSVLLCKGIWLGRRQMTELGEFNESTNSGPFVKD